MQRQSKKTALQEVAASKSLLKAWNSISGGKLKSPKAQRRGIDGDSLAGFAAHLNPRITSLSNSLLSGGFAYSPLQPFFIPKPGSTKERLICVPTVEDRIVQRAILNYLRGRTPWLDNGVSFGFVPNLGVRDAVQYAIKLRSTDPWVFKTDITAFFDQIDRQLVAEAIAKKIKHPTLRPLLIAAMNLEVEPQRKSQVVRLKLQGINVGIGVRQGMPLSPLFANMVLHPFDLACKQKNVPAVRYADDLIFFAKSEDEAKTLQAFCKAELEKLNLNIPDLGSKSKSQIYDPSQTASFLGVEFVRSVNGKYELRVGKEQAAVIKQRILSLGSLAELKNRQIDITRFGSAISATAAAYKAHYSFCSNVADLSNNVEVWRKKALQDVYAALGIDKIKLTDDAKWFLDLN